MAISAPIKNLPPEGVVVKTNIGLAYYEKGEWIKFKKTTIKKNTVVEVSGDEITRWSWVH